MLRRSFVYRKLPRPRRPFRGDQRRRRGAAISARRRPRAETRADLGLADLSPLPRTGFKGAGTVEWLAGQGLAIGPDSNVAYPQAGGELAPRLAPTEIFLIDSLAGTGALVEKLNQAWSWGAHSPHRASRPCGHARLHDKGLWISGSNAGTLGALEGTQRSIRA